MLKTLSACIPQLGTLASDRSGCTFAGGETTTFSPPLANAPLALGETITWTTTDGDGGVCVAGVAKFLADRSVVALRSGGACVSQNYDASGGYISCGGVRRKVDAAALAACGGAGSAGRNTVFKAGIDAYWGTNGLGKIPGEPQTVLRCQ